MIRGTGLEKTYERGARVLVSTDLAIARGEFVYVLGGTGAGKTTLLRILATEEAPTAGQLQLFGLSIGQTSPGTLRQVRQRIGFVPQEVRLLPDLTVRENVLLGMTLAGGRAPGGASAGGGDARSRADAVLERVGLAHRRDSLAARLSGGEAQRVAVARALAREPELLIADEPTGAQDREATWGLMDLLLRANAAGTTVVLATHDREIVRRVRKRCLYLKAGRLSAAANALEEAAWL